MSIFKKTFLMIVLCIVILSLSSLLPATRVKADSLGLVFLSKYRCSVDVGDDFYLIAITSNGDMPKWKSSSSKIASVNTYGKVTAKKPGTATITAKIKNGEASCKVTVKKTTITLSQTSVSLERGETLRLSATTSNQSAVTWKSSKKSIATVDEQGYITGMKPGETSITASVDGSSKVCKVKVNYPKVKLNRSKLKLWRGQTAKLSAEVSSLVTPDWKSNKKSVAVVDENGTVTALKHGTAVITACVDTITRSCEVIVEPPDITVSLEELSLLSGETARLTAKVSSGNPVTWSSSNPNVCSVDENGQITAWQKGRAYIYAAEDGTKVRCVVHVNEKE